MRARSWLIQAKTHENEALARTDKFYYNAKRQQIIEVRDGSDNVERHVVYGSRYIDEVVCIDVNEDADTDPLEGSDSRYFVHQGERSERGRRAGRHEVASGERRGDPCPQEASRTRATGGATWNVTFLAQGKGEDKGAVVEYYRYDPYGRRQIFVDDDDGDAEAWGHQALTSTVGNVIGHKGRWHEPATGLIENRARHNNPQIGRWMQRDPLTLTPVAWGGCQDGLNLHAYSRSNPVVLGDPSGLTCPIGASQWGASYEEVCPTCQTEVRNCRTCRHCPCGDNWKVWSRPCGACFNYYEDPYVLPPSCGTPPTPPPLPCCQLLQDPLNAQPCQDCCWAAAAGLVGQAWEEFMEACLAECGN